MNQLTGSIREAQNRGSFLFGPTYLALLEADKAPIKPYTQLKRPRLPAKGKTAMPEMDAGAIEFELEKNWILAHVAAQKDGEDARVAQELADQAELDAGNGVECGCCFGEYVAVSLVSKLS
jgi:TRIAD3 protein (E3 ubiquitin-protein ligase RNF216)